MNRITLHSESSEPMHTRDIVFEPIDAQLQRDSGNDPLLLRAKKELEEPDSPWCTVSPCPSHWLILTQGPLFILEARVCSRPTRGHRKTLGNGPGCWRCAQLRRCTGICVCILNLPILRLIRCSRRSQIYKRGYVFRRGVLAIQMFQQEQVPRSMSADADR